MRMIKGMICLLVITALFSSASVFAGDRTINILPQTINMRPGQIFYLENTSDELILSKIPYGPEDRGVIMTVGNRTAGYGLALGYYQIFMEKGAIAEIARFTDFRGTLLYSYFVKIEEVNIDDRSVTVKIFSE